FSNRQFVGHKAYEALADIKHRVSAFGRIIVRVLRERGTRQIVHIVCNVVTPSVARSVRNTFESTMPERNQQSVIVRVSVVGGELQKCVVPARAAVGGVQVGKRIYVDGFPGAVKSAGEDSLVRVTQSV